MKKRPEETQTLRTGCRKAVPKIFSPPHTPSRGAGWPKFNQLEMVTTFTYKPGQFGEDRCTQFRVIVATDPHPHTHKQTDRTDYNTLRRS